MFFKGNSKKFSSEITMVIQKTKDFVKEFGKLPTGIKEIYRKDIYK